MAGGAIAIVTIFNESNEAVFRFQAPSHLEHIQPMTTRMFDWEIEPGTYRIQVGGSSSMSISATFAERKTTTLIVTSTSNPDGLSVIGPE
jgi:hypothetical protein